MFTTRIPSQINDLNELGAYIREALAASKHARRSALRHDMDAGDGLIAAQARVTTNWKKWLRENCAPLKSARSAQIYCQLARGREKIEAELERNPDLSQRAALRLLSPPKPKPPKPEIPPDIQLLRMLTNTAAVDVKKGLAKFEFEPFLKVMPDEWWSMFQARLDGQNIQRLKQKFPNTRMKNMGRKQLACVINNDKGAPTTH